MSEAYDAACEIREPLAELRDNADRIAGILAELLELQKHTSPAAVDDARLAAVERCLWDLYPDSARRAGVRQPA